MNDRPDLERIVTDWLGAAAPPRAPEGVLTGALDRVGGARQERPFGGRRFDDWIAASPRLRWAMVGALLAAALFGAIVGVGALLRESPVRPPGAINGWVAYSQHSPLGSQDARSTPMDLYLVHEGIEPHRIAGSDSDLIRAVCPRFSPDGKRLAYAEATQTSGIVNNTYAWAGRAVVILTLDATGSPSGSAVRIPVPIQGGDACPAWSSDGTKLAFLTGEPANVWIISRPSADTRPGDAAVLEAGTLRAIGDIAAFALSPDGAFIATAGPAGPAADAGSAASGGIWLVPTGPGQPRQLQSSYDGGDVSWSPDGTRIATDSPRFGSGGEFLDSSVRVTRMDGTTEVVGSGFAPVWSPDGKRIAYVTGTSEIIVADPDGANVHQIVLPQLSVGKMVWSPDGTRLLFVSGGAEVLISVSATGDPGAVVLATVPNPINGLSWQSVHP